MPKKVKYRNNSAAAQGKACAEGNCPSASTALRRSNRRGLPTGRSKPRAVAITRFISAAGNFGSGFSRQAVHQEAAENPHGQGKGAPEKWVAVVKPGRVMFEMAAWTWRTAKEAMELAAHKLPIQKHRDSSAARERSNGAGNRESCAIRALRN